MQPVDVMILIVGLSLAGAWYIRKYVMERGLNRKLPGAASGLGAAVSVLQRYEYRIVYCQPRVKASLQLLNRGFSFESEADFLVEKGGEFFVAESLDSKRISHWLDNPAHMQELIKICIWCQADGMVLIDTDNDMIYPFQIDIAGPRSKKVQPLKNLIMGAAGLVAGAILAYVVLK